MTTYFPIDLLCDGHSIKYKNGDTFAVADTPEIANLITISCDICMQINPKSPINAAMALPDLLEKLQETNRTLKILTKKLVKVTISRS